MWLFSAIQNTNRKLIYTKSQFITELFKVIGKARHKELLLKTLWPEPASKLYRLRDCLLSAKLMPTFVDRGCCVVSATDPHGRILGFIDWKKLLITHEEFLVAHI
jgi:hypothetical protein